METRTDPVDGVVAEYQRVRRLLRGPLPPLERRVARPLPGPQQDVRVVLEVRLPRLPYDRPVVEPVGPCRHPEGRVVCEVQCKTPRSYWGSSPVSPPPTPPRTPLPDPDNVPEPRPVRPVSLATL